MIVEIDEKETRKRGEGDSEAGIRVEKTEDTGESKGIKRLPDIERKLDFHDMIGDLKDLAQP